MFLTILNLLNFILKYSLKYVNYLSKINNFNINVIVTNIWFYTYILIIRYNSIFFNSSLIDITTFDYNKKIVLKNKLKINLNCITYIFYLNFYNFKLNISSFSSSIKNLCSLNVLFNSSVWLEREVSEMFGVNFINTIDNRILLLDYSFVGHPLLKVFPNIGKIEIYYNFLKGWINYTDIVLKESNKLDINYY